LDLLRLCFEATLVGNDPITETTALFFIPLTYRDLPLEIYVERESVHKAFTLLLARNFKCYSGGEKLRRIGEVITVLWASPVTRGPSATGNLVRRFGMEKFFDVNKKSDEMEHQRR
jgi:hypothetical protein